PKIHISQGQGEQETAKVGHNHLPPPLHNAG
ncbi:hypothetical protein TrRE_jg7413, partial [Triparma retinervis]